MAVNSQDVYWQDQVEFEDGNQNDMSTQKPPASNFEKVRAEQLKYNAERETGYRERALKLYPWICGRCAREFDRKRLVRANRASC